MVSYIFKRDRNKVAAVDENGKEVGGAVFSICDAYWTISHTFVLPEFRGQKIAEQLIDEVVKAASEEGVKLVPACSYAEWLFKDNPKYEAIVYKSDSSEPIERCPLGRRLDD